MINIMFFRRKGKDQTDWFKIVLERKKVITKTKPSPHTP
jgi:hypothetical protein